MRIGTAKRRRLPYGDKLLLLHYVYQKPCGELCTLFGIFSRTFSRILCDRDRSSALDKNRIALTVKRKLFATYPGVEAEVTVFINFARSERPPVPMRMMQDRALLAAERLGHTQFNVSPGMLQGYLRSSDIPPSFRLDGKFDSALPAGHTEKMKELRYIAAEYEARNMYSVDESGIFYRMGPRRPT